MSSPRVVAVVVVVDDSFGPSNLDDLPPRSRCFIRDKSDSTCSFSA